MITILVNLPQGTRISRRFHLNSSIACIFAWIHQQDPTLFLKSNLILQTRALGPGKRELKLDFTNPDPEFSDTIGNALCVSSNETVILFVSMC